MMTAMNLQVRCSTLTHYCIYFLIIDITPARAEQV